MNGTPGDRDELALDALVRQVIGDQGGSATGWKVPAVPDGFVDRVVASRRRARQRRLGLLAAFAAAASFVVGAVVWTRAGQRWPAEIHVAEHRQEVSLAGRGVAVLEAGAELVWTGEADRGWEQREGDAFYRVDPGSRFRLVTPGGELIVLGTCFRVEVNPMKIDRQGKLGFVAGAVAAATVLVTVYEGGVRLVSGGEQVELRAGEQGRLSAGAAPARMAREQAAAVPAMAGGARVPRLLTAPSAETASEELAALRQRVADQERELARYRGEPGGKSEAQKYIDVSKEELLARAARCEIRYDIPSVLDTVPRTVKKTDLGGLTDTERDAVNEVYAEMHTQVAAQIRRLYQEVGGEAAIADKMSSGSLINELFQKLAPGEGDAARARLSRERAGLQPPPADINSTSPGERLFRLMFDMGDELERKLGERIGADRAHALRARKDGWDGSRSSHSGCPK